MSQSTLYFGNSPTICNPSHATWHNSNAPQETNLSKNMPRFSRTITWYDPSLLNQRGQGNPIAPCSWVRTECLCCKEDTGLLAMASSNLITMTWSMIMSWPQCTVAEFSEVPSELATTHSIINSTTHCMNLTPIVHPCISTIYSNDIHPGSAM